MSCLDRFDLQPFMNFISPEKPSKCRVWIPQRTGTMQVVIASFFSPQVHLLLVQPLRVVLGETVGKPVLFTNDHAALFGRNAEFCGAKYRFL